jgi:uncharacterized protein
MKSTKFRILSLVLVLVLVTAVILTGCKTTDPGPAPTPAPVPDPTSAPAPTEEPAPTTAPYAWPPSVDIIATPNTGEAQVVSYGAILEASTGMQTNVVPESKAALRFKAVKEGEFLMTAAGQADFANNIEALSSYATEAGGPWQVRVVWPFTNGFSGYIVKGDGPIYTPADLKAGMKIAEFATLRSKQYAALLAWAGLEDGDVEWVKISSYAAQMEAITEGRVDVAWAFYWSSTLAGVAAAPGGVRPLELPFDTEPEKAAAVFDVYPTADFGIVQSSAVPEFVGKRAYQGLTWIVTRDDADTDLIYNLVKWFDENHDKYEAANQNNVYMTLENLVYTAESSFVPLHDGAIKYLKEKDLWTATMQANYEASVASVSKFMAAYEKAIAAAKAQKIAIDPTNPDWLALWEDTKTAAGLEPFRTRLAQ